MFLYQLFPAVFQERFQCAPVVVCDGHFICLLQKDRHHIFDVFIVARTNCNCGFGVLYQTHEPFFRIQRPVDIFHGPVSRIEIQLNQSQDGQLLSSEIIVVNVYFIKSFYGNLNAYACTKRAIALAKQHTIGCVALSDTNHWMRPGNYGLMAVEENCIGIFWTNTCPNMPPWGGRDARLGNNPITLAIPHGDTPVLVDVAMSMFSYGKLEAYKRSGRELPVEGGLNKDQQPTKNAAEILETHQSYPIGYWKGSGLSLALDLIASALAGGRTTRQVGELPLETELSQVFICINLDALPDKDDIAANIEATLRDMETSTPVEEGRPVHFPGEHMAEVRKDNMENGIPVEDAIWQQVLAL